MNRQSGAVEAATKRRGIQSVGIGLKVLEALAGLGEPSPLGTVAQAAGLSTSQAHRYLSSLIGAGMAVQDKLTGRYDLGPGALRLGLAALARIDAFRVADAAIGDFARRTGRTVQIAALGPLGPTIVRWIVGRPAVATSFNVGSVLPLLHSATGHAFLAFVPERESQPLVERELSVPGVRPVDIRAIVERARAAGYATVDGAVAPGLRAVACPIFDLQGRAVLVATVLASEAFDRASDAAILQDLQQVCAGVTEQLGGKRFAG